MDIELTDVWFLLIGVLFSGFFILEGFDYGVGILMPFLGKDDRERRMIINSIGPFWDGNEVWVLTAGGAIFAAFPHWYATLFSGFYLALFLMLVALILRAVAFEFRSKDDRPEWRRTWDWAIFFGSVVPALLWGVAVANIVRGVPIGGDFNFEGNFFDLLSVYTILGGLVTLTIFTLHGAIFLSLKTGDPIQERAHQIALRLWLPTVAVVLAFVAMSYVDTDIFDQLGFNPGVSALAAAVTLLAVGAFLRSKNNGWAFVMTALTMIFTIITVFRGLYPRVMVSSLNDAYSLTIHNASSSDYTLKVMTIVALTFVPIVLIYQGWTYWVFRKRITAETELEY